MTAESTIDYEALAQEAMRGVVRTVLTRAAKSGLPGDHHFYISFETEAPGVSLSKRLKEKYPREMTIVLQHRFWDLAVTDDRFEVKLTFDGIPERLVVPFSAVKVFFDPSVRFGLQFEDPTAAPSEGRAETGRFEGMTTRTAATTRPATARKPQRATRKTRSADEGAEAPQAAETAPGPRAIEPRPPAPAPVVLPRAEPVASSAGPNAPEEGGGAEAQEASSKPSGGAEIVSLDKFRKK